MGAGCGKCKFIYFTDENQYMDTLSYYHLPQHLRPCFLSFGEFSEDHDILVSKLIMLWIAEGFVYQGDKKWGVRDVTEDIHDLLLDLCLRKAEEENFSADVYKLNKHSYSCVYSLTNHSTKL